jgi:hypothetical protein
MSRAVHHAIDVCATPEACWAVFCDLATWPSWFPMLRQARCDLPWRVGGTLELTFGAGAGPGLSVRCLVEEVDPARRVRWVGGRLGVRGNHAYTFDVNSPGLTRVTSHEDFSGAAMRLIPRTLIERMDDEVHRSMERFKSLVEGRA